MTTEQFITARFCEVDDRLAGARKHPQGGPYPSEVVTLALLFALKGVPYRAFYRWAHRDLRPLFPKVPERTRLLRLFRRHSAAAQQFLAEPSFFTVMDSYGIELLHPVREGRSPRQVGRKGLSNKRWIVGIKLCWLVTNHGQTVAWAWESANVPDQVFRPVAEQFDGKTITLADLGFRQAGAPTRNLKRCLPKTWNERMVVETVFSLVTTVCHLKKLWRRTVAYLTAHLAYVAALFNCLLPSTTGG